MSFFVCVWIRFVAVHEYEFVVCATDKFTDAAVNSRINGEHKEKDLEPWDGGETHNSDSLESLDTDVVGKQTTQTCYTLKQVALVIVNHFDWHADNVFHICMFFFFFK